MFSTQTLQPHEITSRFPEIREAFFSGDLEEIERHFEGHHDGSSTTVLGYDDERLVGIVTIRWNSQYPTFKEQGIPLIQNIEIRWEDRGKGYGDRMMAAAEEAISERSDRAGICVGIFDAYGPAQRLYATRGYIPDGRGVCLDHTPLQQGQAVTVDHDLLLWLVKRLR